MTKKMFTKDERKFVIILAGGLVGLARLISGHITSNAEAFQKDNEALAIPFVDNLIAADPDKDN